MLGRKMRCRLVVLRKAIFSSEFSSPLYLKPTSCVGCPTPLLASCLGYLLRHTSRREELVVQLCAVKPQRRLLTQQDRPTAERWLPVNEP